MVIWYAPSKLDSTLGWPDTNVRFGAENKAAGDAYLGSLHSSSTGRGQSKARIQGFSKMQVQRMLSPKTRPDTSIAAMFILARTLDTFDGQVQQKASLGAFSFILLIQHL